MSTFLIGQGDTRPAMKPTLTDLNGNAVDLTGATVQFLMQPIAGGLLTVNRAATVLPPATAGNVEVDWLAGDTAIAGSYRIRFVVTFAPGQIESFPNATFDRVVVSPGLTGALPSWPTLDDLAAFMALAGLDNTKRAQGALALAGAIDLVRSEARHHIDYIDQDVKALRGNWSYDMWLPEPPVDTTRPTTFSIDVPGGISIVLASDRYRVRRSGLVRRVIAFPLATGHFPMPIFGHWGGDGAEVTVTYSHGYQSIPGDLREIVLAAAARAMANPGGLRQEIVANNAIAYNPSYDGVWLFESEKRICRRYRQWARQAA